MVSGGYAEALGFTVEDGAADGIAAPLLRMPFTDDLVGRPGFLHGGAAAGLIEFAAAAALAQALGEPQVGMTLVTCSVDYLRGGLPVESFAAARVLRLGRRIANLEAAVWQDDRARPIATARLNYLLQRGG